MALLARGIRKRFKLISSDGIKADIAEVVNAKGKPKDPRLAAIAVQCMAASSSMADNDGCVAADALAALIHAKLMQLKADIVAARQIEVNTACSENRLPLITILA